MPHVTRRAVLTGLGGTLGAALWGGAVPAQVTSSPVPKPRPASLARGHIARLAEARVARAGLEGQVSFAVANAWTGELLFARNADTPMAPASTAKMLTAAYALDQLGADHRFPTRVLATGPLRDGVLEGDLILAGGGDPALSSDGLLDLVRQLSARGLRGITGQFQVWDGALPYVAEIDPGQPDHLGYNPALSGLNLNYNRVYFQWRRQSSDYALTLDARTAKVQPPVRMVTMQAAQRSQPIYTVALDPSTGQEAWTVARPALGQSGSRWLPVRGTDRYAAEVFRTIAGGNGITLPGAQYPQRLSPAMVLAQVDSAPVSELARGMLKYSTNLTAEVLGLAATTARAGAPPRDLAASAQAMCRWAQGLGAARAALVDHSGLGPASRITSQDMLGFLLRTGVQGPMWPLLKKIGLKTPEGRLEPFELRAKTGTLNFVSCLAGFVRRPEGPPLAFAIQTANHDRRAAIAPGDEERPAGARSWSRRSREMQYDLIRLWAGA